MPGSYPFRVWGYGTTDPLEEVLGPSYFRSAGGLMHPGDLIYVAVRPQLGSKVGLRPTGGPGAAVHRHHVSRIGLRPIGSPVSLGPQLAPERGEMRMALVMVRAGENGAPSVRLVQDFGCPDDPDAPLAAASPPVEPAAPASATLPKRGRGRPPGSRTRKEG